MPQITKDLITAAAGSGNVAMFAVLILGIVCLALIWLVARIAKSNGRKK